ncbi:hypothetical protein ACFRAU_02455 [Arthrobacter sp. NPDC056691]|uniref:hypothetical protein n=1 Tax=unclassified Arthrobacter TaxID=235627 RepID=UPI00366AA081
MSVLLLSAAFVALLAAGGVWAALPLLTGAADAFHGAEADRAANLDPPSADAAFNVYPYGWKP